jgi:hypothetical protein
VCHCSCCSAFHASCLCLLLICLWLCRCCCRYDFYQVLHELELGAAEQGLQAMADAAFR